MQLVEQLARCRRTPQIRLMKVQDKGVTRYGDGVGHLNTLVDGIPSNHHLIRFVHLHLCSTPHYHRYTWDVDEGGGESSTKKGTSNNTKQASASSTQQGAKLSFVLPWLVTTDKKLGLREIEYLGSQLRLSGLLQLDLARVRRRRVGMWCAQYRVCA